MIRLSGFDDFPIIVDNGESWFKNLHNLVKEKSKAAAYGTTISQLSK